MNVPSAISNSTSHGRGVHTSSHLQNKGTAPPYNPPQNAYTPDDYEVATRSSTDLFGLPIRVDVADETWRTE
jgi:hypothetical protein